MGQSLKRSLLRHQVRKSPHLSVRRLSSGRHSPAVFLELSDRGFEGGEISGTTKLINVSLQPAPHVDFVEDFILEDEVEGKA